MENTGYIISQKIRKIVRKISQFYDSFFSAYAVRKLFDIKAKSQLKNFWVLGKTATQGGLRKAQKLFMPPTAKSRVFYPAERLIFLSPEESKLFSKLVFS